MGYGFCKLAVQANEKLPRRFVITNSSSGAREGAKLRLAISTTIFAYTAQRLIGLHRDGVGESSGKGDDEDDVEDDDEDDDSCNELAETSAQNLQRAPA